MTTTPVAAITDRVLTSVLLVGPLASVAALAAAHNAGQLTALPIGMYLTAAVLAWSPLPVSIPAVLLDNYRDMFRPDAAGFARVKRAAALLPWMLSDASGCRRPAAASLVGFLSAAALALVPLAG